MFTIHMKVYMYVYIYVCMYSQLLSQVVAYLPTSVHSEACNWMNAH